MQVASFNYSCHCPYVPSLTILNMLSNKRLRVFAFHQVCSHLSIQGFRGCYSLFCHMRRGSASLTRDFTVHKDVVLLYVYNIKYMQIKHAFHFVLQKSSSDVSIALIDGYHLNQS